MHYPLADQFDGALALINIDDDRRRFAAEAHTQIRTHLESDSLLCSWGVDTTLIGSYARRTGIYPGKDVDVFTKLTKLSTLTVEPRAIYEATRNILVAKYGDRAKPQPRSVKVEFNFDSFEFAVDVVPAVHLDDRWALPRRDTTTWRDPDERWVETDPEHLGTLTKKQNERLKVDGQGAYVPTVKLVRQARKHHRDKSKPGGFYFELMTYWAFERGEVAGTTFAEILSDALSSIASQLDSGAPLQDPVLGRDYRPTPEPQDRADSAAVFRELARKAREARAESSRCRAAVLWREILGRNEQGHCFPLPPGCDEHGRELPVTAAGASRVSREPGGFA